MTTTSVNHNDRHALRDEQVKQAEELLGALPQQLGVAKGLFFGEFVSDWVFPYPQLAARSADEGRRRGRGGERVLRRAPRPG